MGLELPLPRLRVNQRARGPGCSPPGYGGMRETPLAAEEGEEEDEDSAGKTLEGKRSLVQKAPGQFQRGGDPCGGDGAGGGRAVERMGDRGAPGTGGARAGRRLHAGDGRRVPGLLREKREEMGGEQRGPPWGPGSGGRKGPRGEL